MIEDCRILRRKAKTKYLLKEATFWKEFFFFHTTIISIPLHFRSHKRNIQTDNIMRNVWMSSSSVLTTSSQPTGNIPLDYRGWRIVQNQPHSRIQRTGKSIYKYARSLPNYPLHFEFRDRTIGPTFSCYWPMWCIHTFPNGIST